MRQIVTPPLFGGVTRTYDGNFVTLGLPYARSVHAGRLHKTVSPRSLDLMHAVPRIPPNDCLC